MKPQMNADERRLDLMEPNAADTVGRSRLNQISERIIGAAFEVSNTLGCGFLEKVYENALAYELRQSGFDVMQQVSLKVKYKRVVVGEYIADLIVENQIIIEVKACKSLDDVHVAQCLNYLKGTGHRLGLLVNFGVSKIDVRRLVNKF